MKTLMSFQGYVKGHSYHEYAIKLLEILTDSRY